MFRLFQPAVSAAAGLRSIETVVMTL